MVTFESKYVLTTRDIFLRYLQRCMRRVNYRRRGLFCMKILPLWGCLYHSFLFSPQYTEGLNMASYCYPRRMSVAGYTYLGRQNLLKVGQRLSFEMDFVSGVGNRNRCLDLMALHWTWWTLYVSEYIFVSSESLIITPVSLCPQLQNLFS